MLMICVNFCGGQDLPAGGVELLGATCCMCWNSNFSPQKAASTHDFRSFFFQPLVYETLTPTEDYSELVLQIRKMSFKIYLSLPPVS